MVPSVSGVEGRFWSVHCSVYVGGIYQRSRAVRVSPGDPLSAVIELNEQRN